MSQRKVQFRLRKANQRRLMIQGSLNKVDFQKPVKQHLNYQTLSFFGLTKFKFFCFLRTIFEIQMLKLRWTNSFLLLLLEPIFYLNHKKVVFFFNTFLFSFVGCGSFFSFFRCAESSMLNVCFIIFSLFLEVVDYGCYSPNLSFLTLSYLRVAICVLFFLFFFFKSH